MPLYEYACPACNIAFDAFHQMSDEPLKTCIGCDKDTLIRLFSVPNVKVESEPKTVGELAERNTRKMSKDELAEKSVLKMLKKRKGMDEIAAKSGGKVIKSADTIPWWRNGSQKPLDTSKISNIRKYIETGTK